MTCALSLLGKEEMFNKLGKGKCVCDGFVAGTLLMLNGKATCKPCFGDYYHDCKSRLCDDGCDKEVLGASELICKCEFDGELDPC